MVAGLICLERRIELFSIAKLFMKEENFGFKPENLAQIRVSRGLTARELSLKLNKNASYISGVENGRFSISMDVVLRLSDELNVPPTFFFISGSKPLEVYEILTLLGDLDQEELIMVKNYILHIKSIREMRD